MSYYICKKCNKLFSGPPSQFLNYRGNFLRMWHICEEEKVTAKPIKPEEVFEEKKKIIPEEVFEAFNELIVKEFSSGYATIKQSDVADLIVKKMNDKLKVNGKEAIFTSRFLYDNHFLDIEDVYREAGWKVEYDKPAYNEDYPATFRFSK